MIVPTENRMETIRAGCSIVPLWYKAVAIRMMFSKGQPYMHAYTRTFVIETVYWFLHSEKKI